MSEYIQKLKTIEPISFQKIVDIAYNCLPNNKKARPWSFINHGVDLLETEDELNCYLAAYGKMHEAKIIEALSSINEPDKLFLNDTAVIDWGCGQGLASFCLLEFINKNNYKHNIKEIILIEPSHPALNRAKINVNRLLNDESKIKTVNKFLNNVSGLNIKNSQSVTLHFFSNILDITSVDLKKLHELIENNLFGEHYFFCVGPLNFHSTRIDEFAKLFNIDENQILKHNKGKLINTRGTIKLLVFKIKGQKIEIIKSDFYPSKPKNMNYIHIIEKMINSINPNELNEIDKIMQFYKTVVELEQFKEPAIKQLYQYPIDPNQNRISIDIQNNVNFFQIFKDNLDRNITKWPKDLYLALKATMDDEEYYLLKQVIPFDEYEDIDINTETININISNFEINVGAFKDRFGISDDEVEEIEIALKEKTTIKEIGAILEDKIDGISFELNSIYLALSSKNPALSQIYSEIRRINSGRIKKDSLIENFLLNKEIENNVINGFKEEDLILISDLDKSQRKAVLTAFNNKLSVITGPPGSGKTQVILNIVANAVLHNKKVLVASKNNKAVDNVKERFDRIDDTGYFLRFGKKSILEETTLPSISSIINLKYSLEDNTNEINELKRNIEKYKSILKENYAILNKRKELESKIPLIEKEIEKKNNNLSELIQTNSSIKFIKDKYSIAELDQYHSRVKIIKNNLDAKYSGIGKIWFDWFLKKKFAKDAINSIEEYPLDIKKYILSQGLKSNISDFKNGKDIIDFYSKKSHIFSVAIDYWNSYNKLQIEIDILTNEISKYKNTVNEINNNEAKILFNINKSKKEIQILSKPYLEQLIKFKIYNLDIPLVNNYTDYLPNNIPWRYEELEEFVYTTIGFLDNFNINSVTSLSAKAAFPLENELFDMIVVDEASQCDIASAIPLALRTKQLVIIGDPLQLKHISLVNDFEENFIKEKLQLSNKPFLNYNRKSLWDYSAKLLSITDEPEPVMLDNHYRCHPHIIGYSNEAFYNKRLRKNLIIRTIDEKFKISPKGIVWIDIKGEQKANNVNINEAEANKSIEVALQLARTNNSISIGIVTPFKHQAERINRKIPNEYRDNIIADTVHKFQGDEKDIMIYSLVVTDNSPVSKIKWIDFSVPNLVNVAVTRAKNTLYIVGNKQYIKNNSQVTKPLGKLVEYVERNE